MIFIHLQREDMVCLRGNLLENLRALVDGNLRTDQIVFTVICILFLSAIIADEAIRLICSRLCTSINLKIRFRICILSLSSSITIYQGIKLGSINFSPVIFHVVNRVSILNIVRPVAAVLIPDAHGIAGGLIRPQIGQAVADGDYVGLIAGNLAGLQSLLSSQQAAVEVGAPRLGRLQQAVGVHSRGNRGPLTLVLVRPVVDDAGLDVGVLLLGQRAEQISRRTADTDAGGVVQKEQNGHVLRVLGAAHRQGDVGCLVVIQPIRSLVDAGGHRAHGQHRRAHRQCGQNRTDPLFHTLHFLLTFRCALVPSRSIQKTGVSYPLAPFTSLSASQPMERCSVSISRP